MQQADPSPAAILADFERRARRCETPCGEGSIVWRNWGSGPPLLLAHGAHGSWTHWIRNIDALAAEYTVWALDLPGYGESAMPPHEDHETISAIIADGWRQVGATDQPLDIVGFSFGGVAMAYLASYYPKLVRRLVLVDTGGLDTPRGEVRMKGMRGLDAAQRVAVNRDNLLALMLHHPDSVDELALLIQAANGARGRLDPVPLVLPDKLLHVLPRVRARVDAIWGEFDRPHPDPVVQAQALRRSHPDLEMRVIAGAGHWVMYERPAEFTGALLGLLRRPFPAVD